MTTLTANANSLTMLLRLHADHLIWIATVAAALAGGAWIGSILVAPQVAPVSFF